MSEMNKKPYAPDAQPEEDARLEEVSGGLLRQAAPIEAFPTVCPEEMPELTTYNLASSVITHEGESLESALRRFKRSCT